LTVRLRRSGLGRIRHGAARNPGPVADWDHAEQDLEVVADGH
jgi:hypothetical protein